MAKQCNNKAECRLHTDRGREIIEGETDVSNGYPYRVVGRIRSKIERIGGDVSILEEHRADLLEQLREVVREEA